MKFLISFMIIWSSLSVWADRFEVRVAEKSTVRLGDPVRLGALIPDPIADPELEERVAQIEVFEPLLVEGDATFTGSELALLLRQKLSFQDLKRLNLKVPEKFLVRAQRNYVYEGEMARQVLRQARLLCSQCEAELVEFHLPQVTTHGELLDVKLEIQQLKKGGSFVLPLKVVSSQGANLLWLTGRLALYKKAPVAKRFIAVNQPVTASDIEMKRVDVTMAKDGNVQVEDLVGKLAARTLTMGEPIFAGDLKKELATQRGQTVKILLGNEGFEISSSAIAEDSGAVGEVIRVKSVETRKLLSGTVVEKGTVRIE